VFKFDGASASSAAASVVGEALGMGKEEIREELSRRGVKVGNKTREKMLEILERTPEPEAEGEGGGGGPEAEEQRSKYVERAASGRG
jgi:hypothetical protein